MEVRISVEAHERGVCPHCQSVAVPGPSSFGCFVLQYIKNTAPVHNERAREDSSKQHCENGIHRMKHTYVRRIVRVGALLLPRICIVVGVTIGATYITCCQHPQHKEKDTCSSTTQRQTRQPNTHHGVCVRPHWLHVLTTYHAIPEPITRSAAY